MSFSGFVSKIASTLSIFIQICYPKIIQVILADTNRKHQRKQILFVDSMIFRMDMLILLHRIFDQFLNRIFELASLLWWDGRCLIETFDDESRMVVHYQAEQAVAYAR